MRKTHAKKPVRPRRTRGTVSSAKKVVTDLEPARRTVEKFQSDVFLSRERRHIPIRGTFDLKEIGFTLVADKKTLDEIDAIHTRAIKAAMKRRHLAFV